MKRLGLMPSRRVCCLTLVALILAGACDSATEPSGPEAVITSLTLSLPNVLRLDYEFRNPTSNTLYLFECGGNVFTLVTIREANGRAEQSSTICLGIWTVNTIPVLSGSTYRGARVVDARAGAEYTLAITYSADPNRMAEHPVVQTPTVRWRP